MYSGVRSVIRSSAKFKQIGTRLASFKVQAKQNRLFNPDDDYSFLRGANAKHVDEQYLAKFVHALKRPCLVFPIKSENINILNEPCQFYSQLKDLIKGSTKRIVLSSLYIGTGPKEKKLVDLIKQQIKQYPDIKVKILLDYNRGQRLNDHSDQLSSSKHLLAQLLPEAEVSFFLSPLFAMYWYKRFFLKSSPLNELVSLMHQKCYMFDDDLLVSGANLSELYFTNRQDRYILLKSSKELCDYVSEAIKLISSYSYTLKNDGSFILNKDCPYNPLVRKDSRKLRKSFIFSLNEIQKKHQKDENVWQKYETFISPYIQMKCLGVNESDKFLQLLFSKVQKLESSYMASGYFNIIKPYIRTMWNEVGSSSLQILIPSANANGFSSATGFKRHISAAYNHLALSFLKMCEEFNLNVILYTYDRPEWTFHAKGFWCQIDKTTSLTIFGSSNYGNRSIKRDLEMEFILITKNKGLTKKLIQERKALWNYSQGVYKYDLKNSSSFTGRLIAIFAKRFL